MYRYIHLHLDKHNDETIHTTVDTHPQSHSQNIRHKTLKEQTCTVTFITYICQC